MSKPSLASKFFSGWLKILDAPFGVQDEYFKVQLRRKSMSLRNRRKILNWYVLLHVQHKKYKEAEQLLFSLFHDEPVVPQSELVWVFTPLIEFKGFRPHIRRVLSSLPVATDLLAGAEMSVLLMRTYSGKLTHRNVRRAAESVDGFVSELAPLMNQIREIVLENDPREIPAEMESAIRLCYSWHKNWNEQSGSELPGLAEIEAVKNLMEAKRSASS